MTTTMQQQQQRLDYQQFFITCYLAYTHTSTYILAHIHTCIHAHIHTSTHTYIHTCTHAHPYVHTSFSWDCSPGTGFDSYWRIPRCCSILLAAVVVVVVAVVAAVVVVGDLADVAGLPLDLLTQNWASWNKLDFLKWLRQSYTTHTNSASYMPSELGY